MRTVLVVLSIAIGVFAVGVLVQLRITVSRDLAQSYAEVNPASALIVTEPFDDELLATIRRLPGVQMAEGRRSLIVRFQPDPAVNAWYPMELFVIADYAEMQVNKVRPERFFEPDPASWPAPNIWPPPERALLIERTSLLMANLGLTRLHQGDTVLVRTPARTERVLPLAGVTYDFARVPATTAGRAYGYITFDTLEWLGEPRTYNELLIVVAGDRADPVHIKQVTDAVRQKVERSGRTILRTEIPEPGKLPLDYQFQAISLILAIMGILALLLSSFLIINVISALLAQQTRQIGVMKAIGARSNQVFFIYIVTVLFFGSMAFLMAVPLAQLFSREFIGFLSYFINFNLTSLKSAPEALVFEAIVALLVPFLAAFYPILRVTQITPAEAMADYGLGRSAFGSSALDRMLERIRHLPRPLLLVLRNTFRQKGRLMLTLLPLILSGTIFMAVFSVRASLFLTLETALQSRQHDIEIQFEHPYRIESLSYQAARIPGVAAIEGWGTASVFRVRPDGSESQAVGLLAPPAITQVIDPTIHAGRWLHPADEHAIVINQQMMAEEGDIALGDELVLTIKGDETTWQIVGIIQTVGPEFVAYVNYPFYARVAGEAGRTTLLQVVTEQHDPAFTSQVATRLETHLLQEGFQVQSVQTIDELRAQAQGFFTIIIIFLSTLALLLAVIGGLGLMGAMSITVLERTREIGIMRAIGASNMALFQLVIGEGMVIGGLSWCISTLLAFPIGRLCSNAVGMQLFQTALTYTFSVSGMLVWLGAVLLLAAVATYLPAQAAVRMQVREALAYE